MLLKKPKKLLKLFLLLLYLIGEDRRRLLLANKLLEFGSGGSSKDWCYQTSRCNLTFDNIALLIKKFKTLKIFFNFYLRLFI